MSHEALRLASVPGSLLKTRREPGNKATLRQGEVTPTSTALRAVTGFTILYSVDIGVAWVWLTILYFVAVTGDFAKVTGTLLCQPSDSLWSQLALSTVLAKVITPC